LFVSPQLGAVVREGELIGVRVDALFAQLAQRFEARLDLIVDFHLAGEGRKWGGGGFPWAVHEVDALLGPYVKLAPAGGRIGRGDILWDDALYDGFDLRDVLISGFL